VLLAGPGAPLVAEFSVAEFAAAIGVGTETGKHYLGHALELRYRLPRLWGRVLAGDLAAWKARRVARETISHAVSLEAAGFVDRHVAPVAHRVTPAVLARLVEEAVGRFMPETAERRHHAAADGRHFRIEHDQVSFAGASLVSGELDLADALDLDDAIRGLAAQLADLGSTESLDVRRSIAAGELPRRQLTVDLATEKKQPRSRTTVLHLHLSQAALAAQDPLRLDLHRPRTRHLPVVEPPRLPVPPRPRGHPRRLPRSAPPRHRSLEIDHAPHPAGTGGATGTP